MSTGIVNIRGKQYETVALRVHKFREAYPSHRLITDILHRDIECVVMVAKIVAPDGCVMATGHAEEYRKASEINRTSAVENCETSAIGRALAAFGLGGTEFASADEVARAVSGAKPAAESINPRKLAWDARNPEEQARLEELAAAIESSMPDVQKALDEIDWANLDTDNKAALAYKLQPSTNRLLREASEARRKAA